MMEIYNKRELRNIAISHLADIDYKDFMKVYRKRKSEPCHVLNIDTTSPGNNFL